MELVEDIAQYLAAQGVGVVGVDIFLKRMPAAPISCVSIYDSGGSIERGDPLNRPTFQVLIRGAEHMVLLPKVRNVFSLLHNKWNVLAERYGRILAEALSGAYYLDEASNVIYPLNFYLVQPPGTPGG